MKESEGRGTRAKENADQGSVIGASHWFVGFLASFMAGIIIVIVVQVFLFAIISCLVFGWLKCNFILVEITIYEELLPGAIINTR